jgi:hypothetical protein
MVASRGAATRQAPHAVNSAKFRAPARTRAFSLNYLGKRAKASRAEKNIRDL